MTIVFCNVIARVKYLLFVLVGKLDASTLLVTEFTILFEPQGPHNFQFIYDTVGRFSLLLIKT